MENNKELAVQIIELAKDLCLTALKDDYKDKNIAWQNIGTENKARFIQVASDQILGNQKTDSQVISSLALNLLGKAGYKAPSSAGAEATSIFFLTAAILNSSFSLIEVD